MRFGDYLRSFQSLWGIGVAVTVAGPLALWVPNLQPPWPEGSQMITTISCIIVAILSFSLSREFLARTSGKSPSRVKRISLITAVSWGALVLGLTCGIAYLRAFNLYVVSDQQQVGTEARVVRIVIGTELRSEFRKTAEPLELLRDNGYDPERVWTRDSLLRARFLVFAFFAGMFMSITLGLGLLTAVSGH